jgi:hypothetical protein
VSVVPSSYRGLRAAAVLAALSALSACQPTVQVGLVNAPAVTPYYIVPSQYPHQAIANGYESCPKNGEVDPLPARYPPCPGRARDERPRVAAVR